jgi:bacterioferritin
MRPNSEKSESSTAAPRSDIGHDSTQPVPAGKGQEGFPAVSKKEGSVKPSRGALPTDVQELRRRARAHIENGAVTDGYRGDRETVVDLLNQALATELVCVLRYRRHHFMATGIHAEAVAKEFLQHSNEEQGHADELADRITQLGGEPDFDPRNLTARSHAEYVVGTTLTDMIKENLIAERIAIDSYAEMIRYIGDTDPTTRRMLEGILAVEEEHADDMKTLNDSFGALNVPRPLV